MGGVNDARTGYDDYSRVHELSGANRFNLFNIGNLHWLRRRENLRGELRTPIHTPAIV